MAIDNPISVIGIAIPHGAGAQTGQVRSPRRFRKHLAPDFIAPQGCRYVALLLFFGGIRQQGRHRHPMADAEHGGRDQIIRFLFREDNLLQACLAPAAVFPRQGDAGKSALEFSFFPGAGGGDQFRFAAFVSVNLARALAFRIILQPGARLGAKRGFLRAIVEIHIRYSSPLLLRVSSRLTNRSFQRRSPPRARESNLARR